MAYTTADLNAIIAKLEGSLSLGLAEVSFEGRRIAYRSTADIQKAIAYFKALLDEATDAAPAKPKTRTLIFFGGDKGFGV